MPGNTTSLNRAWQRVWGLAGLLETHFGAANYLFNITSAHYQRCRAMLMFRVMSKNGIREEVTDMTKNFMVFALAAMLSVSPSLVFASDDFDSIDIDSISVVSCGAQEMSFSGTATYSESTQHLVVILDGDEIFSSVHEPENWSTESVSVSEGSHTLVATIYNTSDLDDAVAEDTQDFSTSCNPPVSDEGPGDQGPGGDCCPGPDPVVVKPTLNKGSIKGAVTHISLWARLKPLNGIFRSVFGRTPTYQEWKYWADRLLTDKPTYDALYGAMQWQKLHGQTMGK